MWLRFGMTPDEEAALRDIRGYASANRIRVPRHGYDEMGDAGANRRDVQHALAHARHCSAGNVEGRWKVTGPDRNGDDLEVVVVFDDGLVVVTVM